MSRVSRTDGALYSEPRRSRKRRRCDGHLVAPHWIEKGDLVVWSALPPDNSEIGNPTWWHAKLCAECAPLTPTNTPPSAVTRDAAQGGATTSVPSLTGEGSGGTEASVGPPP